MTRPFFTKERIGHFDIFDRHAEDAISQTKARVRQGYAIDFQVGRILWPTPSNPNATQDMVSRFTLDSATDFLFGSNAHSLSAGLPYPDNSPLTSSYDLSHPANVFVHAFSKARELSSLRSRYGSSWPLMEFWKDNVKVHRDIVDKFIDPILVEAIAKKAIDASGMKDGGREVKDGETLLDHLVNYTEGNLYRFHTNLTISRFPHLDPKILKDETMNIMIAGRTCAIYFLVQNSLVIFGPILSQATL